ncbi:uncharacterized coiled-coil DUF342 family protein [Mycobacterium frederiksbergense]|uniref:Uncharacterized coiled-coil DUF342 family protein n=1 Tax=Mycolicibacterium frederiksbergense TaxID=117567 RepID=A0ABT6L8G1_9MYCO|nr:hypothetical protein [Mycolicibacterium frederiksbergense]MDH6199244.1 uncharacterized coiled-coil DUF342 family protein [Mycolicibacterium frederiksbergense]
MRISEVTARVDEQELVELRAEVDRLREQQVRVDELTAELAVVREERDVLQRQINRGGW